MGTVYKPKYKDKNGDSVESSIYWIKYYRSGKPYRESTKSSKLADAKRLLKKREGEISEGKLPGIHLDRVTVEELLNDVVLDYKVNHRKSLWRVEISIRHLNEFFSGIRAVDTTTAYVKQYIEKRMEADAANGTINRELATLKRAFMLGTESTPPKVGMMPSIAKLRENNIRKGYFEDHEFELLRDALPFHLQGFVTFAYKTGWRKGEISGITWTQVDRKNGIVYLNPGETKNDDARVVYLDEELKDVIESQWQARREKKALSSFLFTAKDGVSNIGDIRKAFASACKDAGIGNRLFHDFRRTAIRNMVRAGIPERVAMMISGHKTRSIFERYNIGNDDDLQVAMKKHEAYIRSQRNSTMGKETGKVSHIEDARNKVSG